MKIKKFQKGTWTDPNAKTITVTSNSEGDSGYKGGTKYAQAVRNRQAEAENEELKKWQEFERKMRERESTSEIDEYGRPRVIGMSGYDPLLGPLVELYAGNKILKGLGELGEFGLAKWGPKNLKNWARGRIIEREFNNSTLPLIPTEPLLNVGWAPAQTFTGYHASNESKLVPNFWYKNWAVTTHDAPYGFYLSAEKPTSGFLTKRPYIFQYETSLSKPMVQVGEVSALGKNATRNGIEEEAKKLGADGIIYRGIKDNQMPNQTILKTLNPDTPIRLANNTLRETSTGATLGAKTLSKKEVLNAYKRALHEELKWRTSPEFAERARQSGRFTKEEIPKLIDEYRQLANEIEKKFNIQKHPTSKGKVIPDRGRSNISSSGKQDIELFYENIKNGNLDDVMGTVFHEFGGHALSGNYDPAIFTSKLLEKKYPLIARAQKYNMELANKEFSNLNPMVVDQMKKATSLSDAEISQIVPTWNQDKINKWRNFYKILSDEKDYFTKFQELLARGHSADRLRALGVGENNLQFYSLKQYFPEENIRRFMSQHLAWAAPTTLGTKYLVGNLNNEENNK